MPLKEGKSQATVSANIKELMDKYKSSGKIGNTKPKSTEHAQKIAAAIAYRRKRGW